MSAFTDATDAVFAAIGEDATYYAGGVAPGVAVKIEPHVPELRASFGAVGFKLAPETQALAKRVGVRKSEVAAPTKRDVLETGGQRYAVDDVTLDDSGTVWVLALKLARL